MMITVYIFNLSTVFFVFWEVLSQTGSDFVFL